MSSLDQKTNLVAVIGAGPAGLYAAQYLARQGVAVTLFNRDIKPGGLAEYGIFLDKQKMRQGLQHQFRRILQMPKVNYFGNLTVGQSGDVKIDQLRKAGFQAFMVTTGAQENNWLGLPGEDLHGVYQANDIVFHYNCLPEKANQTFDLGTEIVMIGVGNVMLDILHYLKKEGKARNVTAYGRRGPTEVKFDRQTLEPVAHCLNLTQIQTAVEETLPQAEKVGRDVSGFFELLQEAREKVQGCEPNLNYQMRFLRSPRRLLGDENGRLRGIVFEINTLELKGDRVVSESTGETELIAADTVIFSIGSRVDAGFGLPVAYGNFVTTPTPRFPVDGISYEVYNPELCSHCEDIFVSGWARVASEGVVGLARKDAERGARAMLQYLDGLEKVELEFAEGVLNRLPALEKQVVNFTDVEKIWEKEIEMAAEMGMQNFKFNSQEAMLDIVKKP
jgi:ferredoxin/flavodoxin---NADP+ reductase